MSRAGFGFAGLVAAMLTITACSGSTKIAIMSYDASGPILRITYVDSSCKYESRTISTQETSTTVRVSVEAKGTGDLCIETRPVTSEVLLLNPVGDREVIDDASGNAIPQE
jgi:hypothetical protein